MLWEKRDIFIYNFSSRKFFFIEIRMNGKKTAEIHNFNWNGIKNKEKLLNTDFCEYFIEEFKILTEFHVKITGHVWTCFSRRGKQYRFFNDLPFMKFYLNSMNTIWIPLEYHWNSMNSELNSTWIPFEYHLNSLRISQEFHELNLDSMSTKKLHEFHKNSIESQNRSTLNSNYYFPLAFSDLLRAGSLEKFCTQYTNILLLTLKDKKILDEHEYSRISFNNVIKSQVLISLLQLEYIFIIQIDVNGYKTSYRQIWVTNKGISHSLRAW